MKLSTDARTTSVKFQSIRKLIAMDESDPFEKRETITL